MRRDRPGGRLEALEQRMASWETRFDEAVASLEARISQLQGEMHVELSAVRKAVEAGDDETRRFLRVLHEDVIERIARLGER